jgi:hypothetical protein
MANDLTKNPWIIDTPSALGLTELVLKVKSLRWVGATTAGHECVVQDGKGRVRWTSVADGANFVDSDLVEQEDAGWPGLIVPTLDSGTLYLTYC